MGNWYRVYIGGYPAREKAENDAKKLKEAGLISAYALKTINNETLTSPPGGRHGTNGYFLHVSSFKERENAEETVNTLKTNGLKAFLVSEKLSGESWFRVYIGKFESEKEARKAGSELRKRGVIFYFKPVMVDGSTIKD